MAKNLFKETLRKEAEIKEVEGIVEEITKREEEFKDVEQFGIIQTIAKVQEGGTRVVKIKTLDCPEGFPIGAATSDEDAKAMVDNLRHYGGELKTRAQVMAALANMHNQELLADQLIEADLIPERTITVGKYEFMIIGNKEARSLSNGALIAELEVDNLPEKYADELLTARIKEALNLK